jgi:aryl-alcohol dehydrogenase-like predicted oxidoreductase
LNSGTVLIMVADDVAVPQRALGSQGLVTSAQGLGTLSINEFYGTVRPSSSEVAEGRSTIHRAIELGVRLFDTADIYGDGDNERLLGETLASSRDQVVIATKFGGVRRPNATTHDFIGRPEYVHQACNDSLRRLGTDYIDLYYQHRADARVPIEETVGAMAELVAAGKVRYLGLSEPAADTLRRAHRVHPISAVQSEYSLFSRDVEEEVIPVCRELGVGFVAYSPLGRGLLTGNITAETTFDEGDWRRSSHPRFSDENLRANGVLVDQIRELAVRREVAPSQVALAWLHHRGDDIVPLPGTKRRRYLEQNVAALDLTLSDDELSILDALRPAGTRYPDMSSVNRSTPRVGDRGGSSAAEHASAPTQEPV